MNTKKVMAAVGLVVFAIQLSLSQQQKNVINRGLLLVIIAAIAVSIVGFISCVYNNTSDGAYTNYITSFAVWIFAAYLCVVTIKSIHDEINFLIVGNYLIAVCVIQCILALMIDMIPAFKSFIDAHIVNIFDAAEKNRLYGIGACLDVAGTRFAAIVIIINAILINRGPSLSTRQLVAYFTALAILIIVGNMIGRTTIIGVLLSLVLIIGQRRIHTNGTIFIGPVLKTGAITFCIFIALSIIFFKTNPQIEANIRFGFEGFFSLVETGHWHTTSNDSLMNMWVWPDNPKTWIIGDGYFEGAALDMNFVGEADMTRYYMYTDIGYCRFIFYFGVVGLSIFILFFCLCTTTCIDKFREWKMAFLFILLLNLVVWVKVASDLFPVFAIFLCCPFASEQKNENPL